MEKTSNPFVTRPLSRDLAAQMNMEPALFETPHFLVGRTSSITEREAIKIQKKFLKGMRQDIANLFKNPKKVAGGRRAQQKRKLREIQRTTIGLGYIILLAVTCLLCFVETFRANFAFMFFMIQIPVGFVFLFTEMKMEALK